MVLFFGWVELPRKEDEKMKICIDCGKPFNPSQLNTSSLAVCGDCVALSRRRFWNSMKMEMKKRTSDDTTNQDKKGKDRRNE